METQKLQSKLELILKNNKAWDAIKKSHPEQAIPLLEEITKADPTYSAAWYGWGVALSNQGKFEEAVDKYTIALHYKPDMVEAVHNLGYCYIQLGEYSIALRKLNQALEIGADKVKVFRLRGFAYMQIKQYDLAKREYDKAITIQPTNNYIAYYHRGMVLMALNRPKEAYSDFQEAIKVAPDGDEKVSIMLWSNQALTQVAGLQAVEKQAKTQLRNKSRVEFR